MRLSAPLMIVLALLLVTAAAGAALAKRGDHDAREDAREHRSAARGNATDDHAADKARHAEAKDARAPALASFRENRTAALAAYHASHDATRASFLENKTRVIEECRAAHNATESGNASKDSCVKDGLKPLVRQARAEHEGALRTLHDALHAARGGALESFRVWGHGHGHRGALRDT